jgi:hypothetical protein
MEYEEIYTDKISKGRRTYFFDIKKSEQGELYLKISESKKTGEVFEHYRLIVPEEAINDFTEIFQKTLVKFRELKVAKQSANKAYSFEKIREVHKQAYLPWTREDDNNLKLLFCEGKQINELTQIFGRNSGAIYSRIKKLELKEKCGR